MHNPQTKLELLEILSLTETIRQEATANAVAVEISILDSFVHEIMRLRCKLNSYGHSLQTSLDTFQIEDDFLTLSDNPRHTKLRYRAVTLDLDDVS